MNKLVICGWEQLWGDGGCSSCQEWVSILLGGVKSTILNHIGALLPNEDGICRSHPLQF